MGDQVPVRCPVCRRTHTFAAPVYPCACGAPVAPPLLRGAPAQPITHRTWTEDWVTARCQNCGRRDQWPQPELGCPCGTVLRIPVRPVTSPPRPAASPAPPPVPSGPQAPPVPPSVRSPAAAEARGSRAGLPTHIPPPCTAPAPRPTFRPVTIRTADDAVTTAALYLRWLGFEEIVQQKGWYATGLALRGPGLVAQVDPTTRPATMSAVECLWLNGLNEDAVGIFFSLAGYATEARARADDLGIPLFVMDLTGTPQPVNGPADALLPPGRS
ncbi:hypothetical protein V1460_13155 [Streptomyces sp. SCSIO 30461]|uniref:hypothetical protein n=1 Tax=Streptomyces sp. SCSIO 30461 TaxID=3118085 RepID=UPI0030D618AF